jgi:LPS-assembly protein
MLPPAKQPALPDIAVCLPRAWGGVRARAFGRPMLLAAPAIAAMMLPVAVRAQDGAGPGMPTAQEQAEPPYEQDDPFGPQTDAAPLPQDDAPQAASADGGDRAVAFEADGLVYDSNADTITAQGNVILRSRGQSVRADDVIWNRNTGQILATGNIRLVDEDGNELYTDRLELTDDLRIGAMENLLLALREGGRLAAQEGSRDEQGRIALTRAAYSACEVIGPDGCPKDPSWRIVADRVVYDPDTDKVRFDGAALELFGTRLLPLPGLTVTTDGRPVSGLLVPDLRLSASNGLEVSGSYYWRLAENRDLTTTAYVYTGAPPMASAQYRQLTDKGAFQVTGYATRSARIPFDSVVVSEEQDWRGYVFANGKFQFDPYWSATGSLRLASDRTFLRRYDISRDDTLRSVVEVDRVDDNSYLSIAGWAFQTLRLNREQGQVPFALPAVDYRLRLTDPVAGGRVELQANSLNSLRTSGQDTQRAFARAQWDLRRVLGGGQEVVLTALGRADVYHSTDSALTETALYRGQDGWQGRAIAIGAVDVKWPFIGSAFGGTQILTPRAQLVASPPIRNLAIPNEDARAVDLEDSNLFALNRFPGYDRVEDGIRLVYGVDWQLDRPGWRVKANIGQSYRLSDQDTILPDGTGLSNRLSDIVGRTEVRFRDFVAFTHRYRLDKDNLAVRRNEIDASVGTRRTYLEAGYLRLNRNITDELEDLQDREELRLAGRLAIADYWSIFGSGVFNLTDREEDPTFTADGFEPLRTRLGVAYADDCLELGFTWRRDYIASGDAERGNTFEIHFALRNIGFN